jgi:hypothetical protein
MPALLRHLRSSSRLATRSTIRLFDVTDGELSYAASVGRHKTRVLSVAWSLDDTVLASGSADGVRTWDAATGSNLGRISVGKDAEKRRRALVWCLAFLRDNTLVSGDSIGRVQFWNCQFGTLLQTIHKHAADVLGLAATADGSTVFASGVDSQVLQIKRVEEGDKHRGAAKWVVSAAHRAHSHDVKALALHPDGGAGGILVTAGVDAKVVVYNAAEFGKARTHRLAPFPSRPPLSFGQSAEGTVLCAHSEVRSDLCCMCTMCGVLMSTTSICLSLKHGLRLTFSLNPFIPFSCISVGAGTKWLSVAEIGRAVPPGRGQGSGGHGLSASISASGAWLPSSGRADTGRTQHCVQRRLSAEHAGGCL